MTSYFAPLSNTLPEMTLKKKKSITESIFWNILKISLKQYPQTNDHKTQTHELKELLQIVFCEFIKTKIFLNKWERLHDTQSPGILD